MNTDDLAQCKVQIAKWVNRRDRLIHEARADGMSLRDIAVQVGLTHSGVAKILKKEKP